MIIGSRESLQTGEREYLIQLSTGEWEQLNRCKKPLKRITAYSKGWFELKVSMKKIKDPFQEEVKTK